MVCWNSYKASLSKGNVVEQIEAASTTEISERRQYLECIMAETDESHNKGNFLECMSLLTKFDPFLQRYTAPSNTTYLSSDS